jgi:hypothetical protein
MSKIEELIDVTLDSLYGTTRSSLENLLQKSIYQITVDDLSKTYRDIASLKEAVSATNDYFKRIAGVSSDEPNFWSVMQGGGKGIDSIMKEINLARKFRSESKIEIDTERREGFERLVKNHILNAVRCMSDTEASFISFVEHIKLAKALSVIPLKERQAIAKELQDQGMIDLLSSFKTAEDAFYRKDFRGCCASSRIIIESLMGKLVEKSGEKKSDNFGENKKLIDAKGLLDTAIVGMIGSLWDLLSRMGSHPISAVDEKMCEFCFLQTTVVLSYLLWTHKSIASIKVP